MADIHSWLLAAIAAAVIVEMLVLNRQRRLLLFDPCHGRFFLRHPISRPVLGTTGAWVVANGSTYPADTEALTIERLTPEGEWVEGEVSGDVDEEGIPGSEEHASSWWQPQENDAETHDLAA